MADVRAICDTDITDAEITNIILMTDERIKLRMDVGSVNALILEDISSLWSAYRCFIKDPNARSLGEYSERRDVALQALKKEIDELIAMANGGVGVVATMEPVA